MEGEKIVKKWRVNNVWEVFWKCGCVSELNFSRSKTTKAENAGLDQHTCTRSLCLKNKSCASQLQSELFVRLSKPMWYIILAKRVKKALQILRWSINSCRSQNLYQLTGKHDEVKKKCVLQLQAWNKWVQYVKHKLQSRCNLLIYSQGVYFPQNPGCVQESQWCRSTKFLPIIKIVYPFFYYVDKTLITWRWMFLPISGVNSHTIVHFKKADPMFSNPFTNMVLLCVARVSFFEMYFEPFVSTSYKRHPMISDPCIGRNHLDAQNQYCSFWENTGL